MPKKIDPQLRPKCVRFVREHAQEHPTLTAAVTAVAHQEDVSKELVRRWLTQAGSDKGTQAGATGEESGEGKSGPWLGLFVLSPVRCRWPRRVCATTRRACRTLPSGGNDGHFPAGRRTG